MGLYFPLLESTTIQKNHILAPKIQNLPWLHFIWQFMEANKEGFGFSFMFHCFHELKVGIHISFNIFTLNSL